MNLSTIVYIGEPELGNGRTIYQLLQIMEDCNDPSWWAWYIHSAMANERETGRIEQPDETQKIEERMNKIMHKKTDIKDVFVGTLSNQQAGLVPPSNFVNYVFKKDIDLKEMWEWIRDHFLNVHEFDYDWFALLRYLADNGKLENDISTKNKDFAKQMNDWFPSYKCTANGIKLYRNGHLGTTPYRAWNKAMFTQQLKANQKVEGYLHLERIILCHLSI